MLQLFKRPILFKNFSLMNLSVIVLLACFNNCSPGFQTLENAGEMDLMSSSADLELKFDEMTPLTMTSNTPEVRFMATSSSSNYLLKCYVNTVEASSCVSPLMLTDSTDGDVNVRVVAQSLNGRILKEISQIFKLDRKPPTLTVISKPADTIGSQTASVQFSVIDNVSSAGEISSQCSVDAAAFAACSSPLQLSNLAIGAHIVKLKASDKAGNISAETVINFTVALGLPTVTISSAPAAFSNSTSASFTFSGTSANSVITGYECSTDKGVTYAACVSPKTYTGLLNQTYTFSVRALDSAGQKSGAASHQYVVDTVVPSTPNVSSNLVSPSNQTSLSLTFSSTDSSGIKNYECSQDGAAFANCTSPKTYSGLSSGSHTFKVKSYDMAGNVSLEGSYTILIDTVAPVLNITSNPSSLTTSASAVFQFTASDSGAGLKTIECQLDTEAIGSVCSSPKSYTVSAGNRTFVVRATDNAGNSAVKTFTWSVTLETTPPPTSSNGTVMAGAEKTNNIEFTLSKAGRISLAVYDQNDTLIRTLLIADNRAVGTHTVPWDGKDAFGNTVASGGYKWKVLYTEGLQAEYMMSLGQNWPRGSRIPNWESGLGNHEGLAGVAVDSTGLYFSAMSGEGVGSYLKLTPDGSTRIGTSHWASVWNGRMSLNAMGGRIYFIQQDQFVGSQGTNEFGDRFNDVGNQYGFKWDALPTGATRIQNGATNPEWIGEAPMDLATSDKNGTAQLIISYKKQNFVQFRNPANGAVLDTVNITNPLGVAIDNQGSALVASGNSILKFSRANKTPQTFITGLNSPYRLDVDKNNGDIYVAERGSGQQVKVYNSNGQLLRTIGKLGGRNKNGLYKPNDGFIDIIDIAADGKGGFWIIEGRALSGILRRAANYDSSGNLTREFYGSQTWVPYASFDKADPTEAWMHGGDHMLFKMKLDFANKSWKIISSFDFRDLLKDTAGRNPFYVNPDSGFGAGFHDWKVRNRNGITYLLRDATSQIEVLKYDRANEKLIPCSMVYFSDENAKQAYTWTNANDDGVQQESEIKRNSYGIFYYDINTLRSGPDFSYYWYDGSARIHKLGVQSWNAQGCPVYADLSTNQVVASMPSNVSTQFNQRGGGHRLQVADDNSIYFAADYGNAGDQFGQVDQWSILGFTSSGKQKFLHQGTPSGHYQNNFNWVPGRIMGKVMNVTGVVFDTAIFTDYNGDHRYLDYSGDFGVAATYAWDKDGLWVGGLFENPNLNGIPKAMYGLASHNGSADFYVDESTQTLYYLAGIEGEVRMYKIKGWDKFSRANGTVKKQ